MQLSRDTLVGVVVTLALVAALVIVVPRLGDGGGDTAQVDPTPSPPPGDGAAAAIVDTPEASTLVATLDGDVARHVAPDGEADGTVPGSWHGRPSVLPVIDQQPGWLQVRLAQRPNGSTAWIRREGVELATTPYRIEIDVDQRRLRLFDAGEVVLDAPAGVGQEVAPTPVGDYFVTFLQDPPEPGSGWGPFVVVTSAHSDTISDFEQSGDAITAIHGPLGADQAIGDDGARVSLGCVRLHLDDLQLLRDVPAGSPVEIIDSSEEGPADA